MSHSNAPTNYGGNLVTVLPANYGATNPVANFGYDLFRLANGDNLASPTKDTAGTQGIGGSVIDFSDFNVPPSTIIYGYSLFSNDTTNGGSMVNLANWSNVTYSPTTGGSGVDLAAVNGVQFKNNVPEAATYGLIFVGAMIGLVVLRRRRSNPADSKNLTRSAGPTLLRQRFEQREFTARRRSDELLAEGVHAHAGTQELGQR